MSKLPTARAGSYAPTGRPSRTRSSLVEEYWAVPCSLTSRSRPRCPEQTSLLYIHRSADMHRNNHLRMRSESTLCRYLGDWLGIPIRPFAAWRAAASRLRAASRLYAGAAPLCAGASRPKYSEASSSDPSLTKQCLPPVRAREPLPQRGASSVLSIRIHHQASLQESICRRGRQRRFVESCEISYNLENLLLPWSPLHIIRRKYLSYPSPSTSGHPLDSDWPSHRRRSHTQNYWNPLVEYQVARRETLGRFFSASIRNWIADPVMCRTYTA